MSEPPLVQDWLPEAGARSLHTMRRHVAAETTADTDAICATVSHNVFFAVPLRTREGNELPPGSVLTSYDEVYDYYAKRADSYVVLQSCPLRSVASDWYVFNESAATLRATGSIGSADAAGQEFVVNSAILFPTAEDGIRGEICITRHPFEDVAAGKVAATPVNGSFPDAEIGNALLQSSLLARLQGDDAAETESLLSPRHSLALRVDDRDGKPTVHTCESGTESARVFTEIFAGDDVALVSRMVSAWYVFSEFAVVLPDRRLRHIAIVQSAEQERLTSSFGYGWES